MVPYVPNLIRVRPYNFIQNLTNRGHRVTVATLRTNERERDDIARLERFCHRVYAIKIPLWRSLWNCLQVVPTKTPLQSVFSWEVNFARQINLRLANCNGQSPFDVIHIEHLRGARYGLYLKSQNPNLPVVWDSVDCISHLFRQAANQSNRRINRWLTQYELIRTERYEGWLVDQFDRTLVTSKSDKEAIAALVSHPSRTLPVSVVPNGVDLDYFEPGYEERRKPATLVISGKMSYHANVTMVSNLVHRIMPRIWAERSDVKLWIVGKDPPRTIQEFGNHPAVTVTGTVDEIRPYLQQATVAVAPLPYGAGIQNKVLEAMACATPVVTSPQAVSALNIQVGRDVLVAQEPEYFAEQVLKLVEDQTYRRQIGRAGHKYVERNHRWKSITARLEGEYNEAIRTKH